MVARADTPFRRSLLARVGSLALLAAVILQLSSASNAAAGETSRITGTVTGAISKSPLQGVRVCAIRIEPGSGVTCANTDSTGKYELSVGTAGLFSVRFETTEPGYISRTFYDEKFEYFEAADVSVAEGEALAGLNEELEEGGEITGRVTNSTAQALEGVKVCARLPEPVLLAAPHERHEQCAQTGADGSYAIEDLPPGEYEVEFQSSLDYLQQFYNEQPEWYAANLVSVQAATTQHDINAALSEGAEISGTVTSAVTGQPAVGIEACTTNMHEVCTTTNSHGEYTIPHLPTGEYWIRYSGREGNVEYISSFYGGKGSFSEAKQVAVATPNTTVGTDETLRAYGSIAGTVSSLSTSLPITGVEVCLRDGGCETTNSDGEYAFTRLEAGKYEMSFYAERVNEREHLNYLSQFENDAANPEADHAPVAMGAVTTVDDALEDGGQISGKMVDAATMAGVYASACAEDLSAPNPRLAQSCAVTVSNGDEYTIPELSPGSYRVVFSNGLPANYFLQYYHDKPTEAEADALSVTPGSFISGIDADLVPNGSPWDGAIAGTVTDSSTQEAVLGTEVCAYAGEEELSEACSTTDSNGEYLLTGLPAGEYDVELLPPPSGTQDYLPQYYRNATSIGEATGVVVHAGQITPKIDGELLRGGRISGLVTDFSTGAHVEGARVCARAIEREEESCVATGARGGYVTPSLPAGKYKVSFEDPSAYQAEYYDGASSAVEAQPVTVAASDTTLGVDAAMHPLHPAPLIALPAPPALPEAPSGAMGRPTAAPGEVGHPTVVGSWLRVFKDSVPVRLSCDAACGGSIELLTSHSTSTVGRYIGSPHRRETVLARGAFALAGGKDSTVELGLTGTGRKWLARAKGQPTSAKLALSAGGGTTLTKRVMVR